MHWIYVLKYHTFALNVFNSELICIYLLTTILAICLRHTDIDKKNVQLCIASPSLGFKIMAQETMVNITTMHTADQVSMNASSMWVFSPHHQIQWKKNVAIIWDAFIPTLAQPHTKLPTLAKWTSLQIVQVFYYQSRNIFKIPRKCQKMAIL